MLDQALEALKKFDFGTPLGDVQAIEDAVVAAHDNADLRKELEQRLVGVLGSDISRAAKDYVCRKLALVGTDAAVPALSSLLGSEANAHLARHALERIPGSEAAAVLSDAATRLSGNLQIGVIGSLGARRDKAAISTLASLLSHADTKVARAAALSLGALGGAEAAAALRAALQDGTGDKNSQVDSLLACAESLRQANQSADALAIYKWLSDDQQPRLVRLAATRGILACSGGPRGLLIKGG